MIGPRQLLSRQLWGKQPFRDAIKISMQPTRLREAAVLGLRRQACLSAGAAATSPQEGCGSPSSPDRGAPCFGVWLTPAAPPGRAPTSAVPAPWPPCCVLLQRDILGWCF